MSQKSHFPSMFLMVPARNRSAIIERVDRSKSPISWHSKYSQASSSLLTSIWILNDGTSDKSGFFHEPELSQKFLRLSEPTYGEFASPRLLIREPSGHNDIIKSMSCVVLARWNADWSW